MNLKTNKALIKYVNQDWKKIIIYYKKEFYFVNLIYLDIQIEGFTKNRIQFHFLRSKWEKDWDG